MALIRELARGFLVLVILLLVLILPLTFFLLPFLPVALVLYMVVKSPRYIVVWLLLLVLLSPFVIASVLQIIEVVTDMGLGGVRFNPRI